MRFQPSPLLTVLTFLALTCFPTWAGAAPPRPPPRVDHSHDGTNNRPPAPTPARPAPKSTQANAPQSRPAARIDDRLRIVQYASGRQCTAPVVGGSWRQDVGNRTSGDLGGYGLRTGLSHAEQDARSSSWSSLSQKAELSSWRQFALCDLWAKGILSDREYKEASMKEFATSGEAFYGVDKNQREDFSQLLNEWKDAYRRERDVNDRLDKANSRERAELKEELAKVRGELAALTKRTEKQLEKAAPQPDSTAPTNAAASAAPPAPVSPSLAVTTAPEDPEQVPRAVTQ